MTNFAASKKGKRKMPAHKTIVCTTLSELLSEYDKLKGLGKTVIVEGNRLKVKGRTVAELSVLDGEEKPEDRFWRAIPQATIDWILQKSEKDGIDPSELVVRLVEAEKAKDMGDDTILVPDKKTLCGFLANARKSAGMTVANAASIADLKPSAIRVIEKGDVSFSTDAALRFLSCFAMSLNMKRDGETFRIDTNDVVIDWLSEMTSEIGSVEKLAQAIGNSPYTLYAIINKRSNVGIDMLFQAANHFGFELLLKAA